MEQPLNQILFGPPGTGKTYNTIFKALDILKPKETKWEDIPEDKTPEAHRKDALQEFNILKDEGRIVFTTFHQSMSYEDFVEGIKPNLNSTNISYKIEDGIFKKICFNPTENEIKLGYDELVKAIKNGSLNTIPLASNTSSQQMSLNGNDSIVFARKNENTKSTPDATTRDRIVRIFKGEISKKDHKGADSNHKAVLNYIKTHHPYEDKVLIIDEINRGNVANIFGELITLIENDKRTTKWDDNEGKYVNNPEGIKVKLPYSNDEFGVPGNLYIIGTMNTADRSVEALDSALRRRFTFEEMMPKPELLKDVKISGVNCVDTNGTPNSASLADFLYTINRRIEVLKDREHQIGHSYFMQFVDNQPNTIQADALKDVIYKKVIPLLQEYFYGDYEKIQLVLGKAFVDKDTVKTRFPGNVTPDDDVSPYKIKDVTDFTQALKEMDLMKYVP